MTVEPVLRIAVAAPLRRLFDYLPPAGDNGPFTPGIRLRVPFGRQRVVGVLIATAATSDLPRQRLKRALARLDDEPVLDAELLALARWASDYYHHPLGEVCHAALPALLRQGQTPDAGAQGYWQTTSSAPAPDAAAAWARRAPRQAYLLALLREHPDGMDAAALAHLDWDWRRPMAALLAKQWVRKISRPPSSPQTASTPPCQLNADQAAAVAAIHAGLAAFGVYLLHGVTGSGKTEVYLQAIEPVLAQGRQVLVLVPEIGLTPQLLQRFQARFAVPITVLHSGLNDTERLQAWTRARAGQTPIVLGTRSALFTPLPRLGLILIDEEHDLSFKQQDGLRYSARDLAIVRAQRSAIPVVLGSATPALESLHRAQQGRYHLLQLPERAGCAVHPELYLIDVRGKKLTEGFSPTLLEQMQNHLAAGGQVLLFLNRRGYAPVLLCHDCGWAAECRRCDARLTWHRGEQRLRCHHCGAEQNAPRQCPQCHGTQLRPLGHGTERAEQALREHFPAWPMTRIDRDSTRRKHAMAELLEQAQAGHSRILLGTQLLAKGHHFPEVTLVGILDADQGLYSVDFRAPERLAQLILQVAGRAGRAERPGQVFIQTHQPEHPLLRLLLQQDYRAFADAALAERRQAGLPPFSHWALLRAEATDAAAPLDFLSAAAQQAQAWLDDQQLNAAVQLLGPVPAPMERRAGRRRAQLLLQAEQRADLHRLLTAWLDGLQDHPLGRKVRWSLDVDPLELH